MITGVRHPHRRDAGLPLGEVGRREHDDARGERGGVPRPHLRDLHRSGGSEAMRTFFKLALQLKDINCRGSFCWRPWIWQTCTEFGWYQVVLMMMIMMMMVPGGHGDDGEEECKHLDVLFSL